MSQGTRKFMSIACLDDDNTRFRHSFVDDMESFYYVLLYCGVRWLPHYHAKDFKIHIEQFFERSKMVQLRKKNFLRNPFSGVIVWHCSEFGDLLNGLRTRKWADMWRPEVVDKLWRAYDEKDLPQNDKCYHFMSDAPEVDETSAEIENDQTRQPSPQSANTTMAVPFTSNEPLFSRKEKRNANDADLDEEFFAEKRIRS